MTDPIIPPTPPASDPLAAKLEMVEMQKRVGAFLKGLGKNAFITMGWQVPDGSLSIVTMSHGLDPLLITKGMAAGMNNYIQQLGAAPPPTSPLIQ